MVYRKYEDSLMVYEIYSVCYKMIAVLNHVFILVILFPRVPVRKRKGGSGIAKSGVDLAVP
jgi:hypothetical protein